MEDIYKEYASKIYAYIFALCNNSDISEEILQETFYSALKNINNFRNECSIYTWLCKIAKNKWKDYLKKHSKISFIDLDINIKDNSCIETDFENKDNILYIYKKIHNLDNTSKEIFYLRLTTNLTFKEIGDIFDKTEQWARTTFYRAKLKIKEELENEQD